MIPNLVLDSNIFQNQTVTESPNIGPLGQIHDTQPLLGEVAVVELGLVGHAGTQEDHWATNKSGKGSVG